MMRRTVETTIAPAFTATKVIFAGMYLFCGQICERPQWPWGILLRGISRLESLWTDDVGDAESSRDNSRS